MAAHSNSKGLSFPAIYPYVFSARAGELFNSYCEDDNRWGYSFAMPSKHKININENLNYVTQIANSYAAPVLTAKIYNILNSKSDNKMMLNELGLTNNIFLCESPFFLDNVTIINLDREVVVLKEILLFKVKGIHCDIRFETDMRDYIFIPNENKEITIKNLRNFLNALPKNKNGIRIFYLGISYSDIESIMACYQFEFWLLPNNDIYPIGISNADLNHCGIIYFQGDKEIIYYIMAKLRDVFLEDGFNCLAISDYLEATLYGIYYFKDLANSIRRQQLEYVLEPDVELVYSKDSSYRKTDNSILIEVMKEKDRFKFLISEGKNKEEIDIFGEVDFKMLFNRILSMG